MEKVLPGKNLDRVELSAEFAKYRMYISDHMLRYVLCCAEADGLVGIGPACAE